ncbi:MAG: OmpA family protein [Prevotella sp.]|nr:OmpA family protein [Prevotella sp.]
MRKLFFVLAFAGISVASMAQDVVYDKYSVATNSFWDNWFVQVGGQWNVFYGNQEHGLPPKGEGHQISRNIYKTERANAGIAVAVGKWFTPGIGVRIKASGIWGKGIAGERGKAYDYNYKYWNGMGHVLFNLSNLICGYNENRFWNVVPFAGGGLQRNCDYNLYAMGLSAGLMNTFRISKKFDAYLEVGYNRFEEDFDGHTECNYTGNPQHLRGWMDKDQHVYAELGLTYKIGKSTWDKVPDVSVLLAQHQAAIDLLNEKIRNLEAENNRLKGMLPCKECPECPPVISHDVMKFIATPISVFFNLDKTEIASQKDLVNVRALAQYAKANDNDLLVTGYADSATGSAEHNQWLSEQRAAAVATELVNMGINSGKIQTVGKGGVDTLSPISFNRRATVQITNPDKVKK